MVDRRKGFGDLLTAERLASTKNNAAVWERLRRTETKGTRAEARGAWEALGRGLDPGLVKPRLADDIEVAHFTTRWGGAYAIVKNPRGPAYFRLSAADGKLLERFDGTRTVREIVVAGIQETGSLELSAVTELVKLLYESGFLVRPWIDAYGSVQDRLAPKSERGLDRLLRFFRTQTIQYRNPDGMAGAAYRYGGRFAFTWPAQVVFLGLLFAGVVAFYLNFRSGRYHLVGHSLATGFGILFVLDLLATFVHEAGHALAIKHARRNVISAGFQLYFGHPAFFIDSADILMSPPRDRIRNAWYGPYSGFIIAGLVSIIVYAFPHAGVATMLFRLSVLTYLTVLLNLIPFLELDGYWILMDALETTDLRPRSLAFIRHELPARMRRRQGMTRYELALTGFGIIGALFSILALSSSWFIWRPIFTRMVVSMWHGGWWTRVLLVILAAFVLGPLIRGLYRLLRSIGGHALYSVQRLRFLAERRWRVDAGELIAELPVLDRIPVEDLNELAGRVRLRRYTTGEPVVRQGEPAAAFFVVRRGLLGVVERAPGGEEDVRRYLSRGEAFGELGLLESRPRTATVRAEETSQVFVVDKGTFERLLARRLKSPEIAPTLSALAEVRALGPFARLETDEAAELAQTGAWVNVGPGETVVAEGEPGDGFFVVGSGQLQVSAGGQAVRVLQAGDFFGEIALLLDVPRTATVRSLTPARLFRIDRAAFDRLVATSFKRGSLRPRYEQKMFSEVRR